ncbi:extracellular solute-binding protein family 1 [Pseudarthrobacter chlorophenolicus A6]|uniref:Extracellular solute-binding protein family 1 n=1 Tax=Pseudarthrobacter chlorophenolicus (strain ATCC 700700 / DSM 12829 / CIP 107037 / JCM 12360 / KCTC 9906 / NCIMB 13794 / A6) TaxID=452863 RepID=B8H6X3_PSECP|nr:sugar ABC transporter substrate-binding protein [Pseudarthrobacter chlorophenolicus]ACL39694.1 extracellular solute-binding protein family 1 [Pseudarthrobacter chlorophenolicus A6]SDQ95218.1 carbohydrate ABC transporter substrate-binding protein, CUT1 family [Pseudarthrobacter chlorophenolicus]
MRPKMRAATLAAGALCVALGASACAGAGGGNSAGDPNSISVLMVNNPQMEDLQRLTAENFTKETGIKVNYTILPENDVRAKISQEFSSQAGQYDVASLSNYEIPFYSANGWLAPLDDVAADPGFDQDDVLPAYTASLTGEDGKLYGEPFYGESSFLMYRKDILEAKGLTMPAKPTWDEVAEIAAKVDGAEPGMKGICLRGQPGWGQVFAPLTTVVNTFGGTWFDKDWNAQVNSPEFTEAVEFYTKLVREHGEAGAAQAGFTECLNNMSQSKTAMWYDATSAAGALEAEDSPVKGKIGYAQAPVKETKSSGWLWTWSWAMQAASKKQDSAEKFIAWASSKDYEQLVASELGWAKVPSGKRISTYENAEFQAAAPFFEAERFAIENADPKNPGAQERPAVGIQFVGIPEFAALGTNVSQGVSSAIAGQGSVADALAKGQQAAQKVGAKYKQP